MCALPVRTAYGYRLCDAAGRAKAGMARSSPARVRTVPTPWLSFQTIVVHMTRRGEPCGFGGTTALSKRHSLLRKTHWGEFNQIPAATSRAFWTRSIAIVTWYALRLRRFMSVAAGVLTIWSPQIFEKSTFDLITETTWQTGGFAPLAANSDCRRSTSWRMSWIRVLRLYLRAAGCSFSRSRWFGLSGSWSGCGEQAPLTFEAGQVATRSEPSEPFEIAIKKSRGFLRGFFSCQAFAGFLSRYRFRR